MKKSDEPPAKIEAGDLEFPDWSDMVDSSSQISVEAAFRLCDEYASWLRPDAYDRRPPKCEVEFVL